MKKFVATLLAASLGLAVAGTSSAATLNVSVPDADNSYIYAAAQEFTKRATEYSNGSLEMKVFPNGSLYGGDANAAVSSVGNGSLDVVILAASLYASFNPEFYVLSVPYLFDNTKQLQDYINSEDGVKLFNSVEDMGITYLGPVDGHNVPELVRTLKEAKRVRHAVLVHVLTKKGKGYAPAEKNPSRFHGISPFDVATGKLKSEKKYPDYTDIFAKKICQLAEKDPKICAITALANNGGTALPICCWILM